MTQAAPIEADGAHDALLRVRRVVDASLRPLAKRIDVEGFYPVEVLRDLGAAGAFAQHHAGYGDCPDVDLGLAIRAIGVVAETCLSTAFCAWCQNALGWYLQNAENGALRALLQARVARGDILGGTGLSNPMKALSGIEPMRLRGERVAGGYRVNGLLPWVSNIDDGHYFAACFTLGGESGDSVAALFRVGHPGVEARKGAEFIALEGTATRAVGFRDVFVADEMTLSPELPRYARRIRPGFVLLQCGMAAGLVRNCAQLMRQMSAKERMLNAVLGLGPDALEEALAALEERVLAFARTPFEEDAAFLKGVLRARLDGSELALSAAQALMLHAGARAYLRGSVYERRLREAFFIAIVTPATKHLRRDISALESGGAKQ